MALKHRVYSFLNTSKIGGLILGSLICFSIVIFCAETEFSNNQFLFKTNFLIAIVFGIEYLFRIWSANAEGASRRSYIFSFFGIIDLVAFLPVLILPLFSGSLILRLLRIMRLLQILKIRSLSKGLLRVKTALLVSQSELIVTVSVSALLVFLGAVGMYFVEGAVQPEQFGSIPRALWWSVATLTTVGYGDAYPITAIGKVLAALIAFVGIAAVALPSGILAAAFMKAK